MINLDMLNGVPKHDIINDLGAITQREWLDTISSVLCFVDDGEFGKAVSVIELLVGKVERMLTLVKDMPLKYSARDIETLTLLHDGLRSVSNQAQDGMDNQIMLAEDRNDRLKEIGYVAGK